MLNKIFPALIFAVLILTITAFAQPKSQTVSTSRQQIMPVAEVREGMKGTARTVFRGSTSEKFGVEILGVIPNWIGPRQDVIIGKLSGANAERTFVFAGMSGSPVYVDGKLIGAISYSFPFAKEPICGITPFEQMTSVMEQAVATTKSPSSTPRTFSYAEMRADLWRPLIAETPRSPIASGFGANSRLMAIAGQSMVPISTPLYISGLSQSVIDAMAPELSRSGVMPVAASSGDSGMGPLVRHNEKTLLGGDSVMVFLSRGDIQIGAAGTVTHRDGEKIYAFGHPFFSLGSADLPMTESHVVTVIPNTNNSFKLAVADSMVGSMTQDRATAIYGKLGQAPKMLPIKLRLINSRGRAGEINFESAFDEFLTPLIVSAGVSNALIAQERGLGEMTIEMKGEIRIKGEKPIVINRRFGGAQALPVASSAAAIPLAALLRANFDGMEITGVDLTLASRDGGRSGTLDRITVDRSQARAGETVQVTVYERTEAGQILTRRVPITIPADLPAGILTVTVGDGNAVQQNSAITQFTPRTAAELISTINGLKRPDRLYVVLTRTTAGSIIGASELPNLPPSMLATLNNDRTAGGSKGSVQTIVTEVEIAQGESITTGSQNLTIEIIR